MTFIDNTPPCKPLFSIQSLTINILFSVWIYVSGFPLITGFPAEKGEETQIKTWGTSWRFWHIFDHHNNMILMWQNIPMGHYSLQWNPIELYKKWKDVCQSKKFSEITQIDIWSNWMIFIRGDDRTLLHLCYSHESNFNQFPKPILFRGFWGTGRCDLWNCMRQILLKGSLNWPSFTGSPVLLLLRIYIAWITISQQLAYCIETNRTGVSWGNETVSTTAVTCSTKRWHSMAVGYVEAFLITILFIIALLLYSNIFFSISCLFILQNPHWKKQSEPCAEQ